MTFQDLMAGPPPTHLPADPAAEDLAAGTAPEAVVRAHPESPTAWAALAQQAREAGAEELTVYAYARVGYHRSLDLLRRNGWKGTGPVPWAHEPNRGFLTCLAVLARSAAAIGEGTIDAPAEAADKQEAAGTPVGVIGSGEAGRCATFLRDSSPEAARYFGVTT